MTSRREFIRLSGRGVSLLALGHMFPAVLPMSLRAVSVNRDYRHTILVLVQLVGGNDGLNTIVPYGDEVYHRLRPNLALGEKQVLKLSDSHGLHPACQGLHQLYFDGKLAVVQGVGYSQPNRSHFGSTEIWESGGLSEPPFGTGWLGPFLDLAGTDNLLRDDPAAVHFSHQTPRSLLGETNHPIYGFNQPTRGNRSFDRIRSITDSYRTNAPYPETRFGHSLQNIAALIASETCTRIYHLTLSGFDTHSHQAHAHHNLLKTLSEGLMAFQRDLQALHQEDRVLTMTYSEFGRRIAENEMRGTDHGTAAPMFILGSRVNGGLHGAAPKLPVGASQDLAHGIEHRQVYTTILNQWLGQTIPIAQKSTNSPLNFI